MHLLTSESRKAAVPALVSNTATFQTDLQTGYIDPITDIAFRQERLRLQFVKLGLNVHEMGDGHLAVGGRELPDMRAAVLFLRDLTRGLA
jgi:hypothetical protein